MSDTDLVNYYAKTLLLQYVTKPKAFATIQAFADALMISDLANLVRDGYNLDNAVGAQLDVLGKYAGIGRLVIGYDASSAFFGYLLYSEEPPKAGTSGYLVYGQAATGARFRRYVDSNTAIYSIPDNLYRQLIKMKILKNHSNGSLESIDSILSGVFGNRYLVDDDGDMFLRYVFQASDALTISIAEFTGLLPRPTGVGIEINIVPNIAGIFAFKRYGVAAPVEITGFKLYGIAKDGGMARYG